ncbi:hypothetical protein D3C77_457140 [compost metagenome]
MTAGHQHIELAGLHIHLVDVRACHIERAVIAALHDGQLARCREAAHRFGIEPGIAGIHIQARLLHLVVVIEHARRVGDGVDLLAVMADGEGEHRACLLARELGDAGMEHLLAAVQLDAIDIGVVVVQHIGDTPVRRQLHGARAEGVGHLAGLVQAVAGQVQDVQVVGVVDGDQVLLARIQGLAGVGKGYTGTGGTQGQGGQAAGCNLKHANIPLVRLGAHLSSGNTVPRLRQLSLDAWASLFQSG